MLSTIVVSLRVATLTKCQSNYQNYQKYNCISKSEEKTVDLINVTSGNGNQYGTNHNELLNLQGIFLKT